MAATLPRRDPDPRHEPARRDGAAGVEEVRASRPSASSAWPACWTRARFRTFIAEELEVSVENVTAFVLGGHGDTMVPLPRYSTVAGIPDHRSAAGGQIEALVTRTANGGAEIVGSSRPAAPTTRPAASTVEMIEAILKDKKKILPCAAYLERPVRRERALRRRAGEARPSGVEQIIEIKLTAGGERRASEVRGGRAASWWRSSSSKPSRGIRRWPRRRRQGWRDRLRAKRAAQRKRERDPRVSRGHAVPHDVGRRRGRIEFYKRAFGAKVRMRMANAPGGRSCHAGDSRSATRGSCWATRFHARRARSRRRRSAARRARLFVYVPQCRTPRLQARRGRRLPRRHAAATDMFWGDRFGRRHRIRSVTAGGLATHKEDVVAGRDEEAAARRPAR